MTDSPAICIVLVAPGMAYRLGLRLLLEAEAGAGLVVAADAPNLASLESLPFAVDVLVMAGEALPGRGLEQALGSLKGDPGLLLLAEDSETSRAALRWLPGLPLRAWGLLSADASIEEIIAAVRALHLGLAAASPPLLRLALPPGLPVSDAEGAGVTAEPLTARETQVLQYLGQGLANKQIAAALGISEHTVKFHVSSIYAKLGATNRTEAVRLGLQLGLFSI